MKSHPRKWEWAACNPSITVECCATSDGMAEERHGLENFIYP